MGKSSAAPYCTDCQGKVRDADAHAAFTGHRVTYVRTGR